jgi:hypothetical protein
MFQGDVDRNEMTAQQGCLELEPTGRTSHPREQSSVGDASAALPQSDCKGQVVDGDGERCRAEACEQSNAEEMLSKLGLP